MGNLKAAVHFMKTQMSLRMDQLNALGVSEVELREALSKEGLRSTTKYYGGGIFGDDNPFEDDDPATVYLDLDRG